MVRPSSKLGKHEQQQPPAQHWRKKAPQDSRDVAQGAVPLGSCLKPDLGSLQLDIGSLQFSSVVLMAKIAELGAANVQTGGCQGQLEGLCQEGHVVAVLW